MRTALDNNVLSALLSKTEEAERIAPLLGKCKQQGQLMICGLVYCELRAHPVAQPGLVDDFLRAASVEVDWLTDAALWKSAADVFALHADRRRRNRGETPKRLVADFAIGAHALHRADRFFTLDKQRYASYFPDLLLIDLSSPY